MNKKLIRNAILVALTIILFTACNKNPEKKDVSENQETPIASKEMTQLPSEEDSPSSTIEGITVMNVSQEGKLYKVEIDKATMYGGRKAIEVAMKETKCPIGKVSNGDCAPSLNNNFYISNPEKKTETLEIKANAKIEVYTAGEKREIDSEGFYNLWTQTDAFSGGYEFFTMELDSTGKIIKLSSVYLP